jgi:hypothetical protein
VLAQEHDGTAALSLESEEFKLKKRKVDQDARALASNIGDSSAQAVGRQPYSPDEIVNAGTGVASGTAGAGVRVKIEGGHAAGRGVGQVLGDAVGKGNRRGGGGHGSSGGGGGGGMNTPYDDDQLSTHSTDVVVEEDPRRSSRRRSGSKSKKQQQQQQQQPQPQSALSPGSCADLPNTCYSNGSHHASPSARVSTSFNRRKPRSLHVKTEEDDEHDLCAGMDDDACSTDEPLWTPGTGPATGMDDLFTGALVP